MKLSDVDAIDTQMVYCSKFVHDRARSLPERPSGSDIIEGDIKKLDDWVNSVRKRRRER